MTVSRSPLFVLTGGLAALALLAGCADADTTAGGESTPTSAASSSSQSASPTESESSESESHVAACSVPLPPFASAAGTVVASMAPGIGTAAAAVRRGLGGEVTARGGSSSLEDSAASFRF